MHLQADFIEIWSEWVWYTFYIRIEVDLGRWHYFMIYRSSICGDCIDYITVEWLVLVCAAECIVRREIVILFVEYIYNIVKLSSSYAIPTLSLLV